MKKLINDYFPYVLVFFLTGALIFVLTRPTVTGIDIDGARDERDSVFKAKDHIIDSLSKSIAKRDLKIEVLDSLIENKETQIIYKIIENEKKYDNIRNMSLDSSVILFRTNFGTAR